MELVFPSCFIQGTYVPGNNISCLRQFFRTGDFSRRFDQQFKSSPPQVVYGLNPKLSFKINKEDIL